MARLLEALKEKGIEITEAVEKELLLEFAEKKELDLKANEAKELGEQLTKRDLDIAELKKQKPEDLTGKVKELEETYAKEKQGLEEKLTVAQLDGELKVALLKTGAKDVDILATLIDRNILKLEKGNLTGLTEQVAKIKTEKAFLFGEAAEVKKEEKPAAYEYKPGSGTGATENQGSLGDAIAERMGLE